MAEIDVNKSIITIINILVLLGLPVMAVWHTLQAKKREHLSQDWMIQIFIVFTYIVFMGAEIPALWARWISYYELRLPLPDILYKLSAWDRYQHLFGYVCLFFLSYTFTVKKVPDIIKNTFG